jgi:hypothetical protein
MGVNSLTPVYWFLKDKKPVGTQDIKKWGECFHSEDRIVGKTEIGNVEVSTVFLGIDHNFLKVGPPLLFETMIFGGDLDGYQKRFSTWEEAEQGHKAAIKLVKSKSV